MLINGGLKAIVAPGNACSQIQIDAYKKYILVGLLLDGKVSYH